MEIWRAVAAVGGLAAVVVVWLWVWVGVEEGGFGVEVDAEGEVVIERADEGWVPNWDVDVVVGVTEVVVGAFARAEWARKAERKFAKKGRWEGMVGIVGGGSRTYHARINCTSLT